jgi:hypothetical protein
MKLSSLWERARELLLSVRSDFAIFWNITVPMRFAYARDDADSDYRDRYYACDHYLEPGRSLDSPRYRWYFFKHYVCSYMKALFGEMNENYIDHWFSERHSSRSTPQSSGGAQHPAGPRLYSAWCKAPCSCCSGLGRVTSPFWKLYLHQVALGDKRDVDEWARAHGFLSSLDMGPQETACGACEGEGSCFYPIYLNDVLASAAVTCIETCSACAVPADSACETDRRDHHGHSCPDASGVASQTCPDCRDTKVRSYSVSVADALADLGYQTAA